MRLGQPFWQMGAAWTFVVGDMTAMGKQPFVTRLAKVGNPPD